MKTLQFIFAVFVFASCDNVMHEYLNDDGGNYCAIPVKLDSSCTFEATVVTEHGYLILEGTTGMQIWKANRLEQLNMDLELEGKIIPPDEEEITASWLNKEIVYNRTSCCLNIADSLGIDTNDSTFGGSDISVRYSQKYRSITDLPEEVTIHLHSVAVGGQADSTFTMKLKTSKDTRAPIRFH